MEVRSAGIVLFRGEQVLLLHYEAGHWDFPKGHIESGESEQATALRELQEETGISEAALVQGFRHLIRYKYKSRGRLVSKTVVFFAALTSQKRVRLSREHIGYKWLPYDQALRQLTFKNAKSTLEKARAFLDQK